MRFIIYNVIPIALFLIICFVEELRVYSIIALLILGVSLSIYGKNYKGENVILGIKRGWFGKK